MKLFPFIINPVNDSRIYPLHLVAKSYKLPDIKGSICVTDSGEGVCVDPREKGAILEAVGPGPPGGGKGWQLAPDTGGERT